MNGHTNGLTSPKQTALPGDTLLDAYRFILRARLIDDQATTFYKQNKSHFQISCAGHEAIGVAAAMCMRPGQDWAYPYYRDLAFACAWGMTDKEQFLGVLNKADDPASGGRQMPMHFGHQELQIVTQSSPTGTQYTQAVGTALSLKYRNQDGVVYVSSGEGTTSQGAYHEALNWAAREKLPVIFVVQNNRFAISVPIEEQIAGESVQKISSGYENLEVAEIDGVDFSSSYHTMKHAVDRARCGEGPSVVVADVVRLQSHSISDNHLKYRTEDEIAEDKKRDPLLILEKFLIESKVVDGDELSKIKSTVKEEVQKAARWAEEQPDPAPASYADHVVAPNPPEMVEKAIEDGEELFMVESLNRALREEMERDENVLVFGQDVAHGKGGVFSVTQGLTEKFGVRRCFNAPLAEESIAGAAVGLSVTGLHPVAEIQFGDYIWTAMMQIQNELGMIRYRSNGNFSCPSVLRVAVGGYIHGALYHSQSIEAVFAHHPGLVVIFPSNAADAKGLLKSAIRSPDPVLFLEHKGLYRQVYSKAKVGGADHLIPIGKARVAREGSDATIVTWGALVKKSLLAAEAAAKEGFSVEVIDLRTIRPLDMEAITKSVKKTNRLLIAHEDQKFMGFGSEIAATISEDVFEHLDAPVRRIGAKSSPVAHAPDLESQILPQTSEVTNVLIELLEY